MDLTEKPAACDVSVMEQKKAEAPPGASADGNGVVSSGADDLFHGFHRRHINGLHDGAEYGGGLAAEELNASSLCVRMENIVAAVYIPEDDIRDSVTVDSEQALHLLVEGPFPVAAGIDLHVGNNDQGPGHFLCGNTVQDRDLQNVPESGLQVGVHHPVSHVDAGDLLGQGLALQDLNAGRGGEGHEHVVVGAGVPFGKVDGQADGGSQRSAVHGAGGIRDDKGVGALFHIVGELLPLGFQSRIRGDSAASSHDLFDDVVRVQGLGVDGHLSFHGLADKGAVARSVMSCEGVSVDHHGS